VRSIYFHLSKKEDAGGRVLGITFKPEIIKERGIKNEKYE
jgi:hypothetical protein